MVKAKPNQKIHVDKLSSALDKLDQLESKPKEELTLRESIYFLRGKLNGALKKGYNYEDLSEILAEQDILVSAATLKLYLTQSSKSKKSGSRKTKSKSNSSEGLRNSTTTSTKPTKSTNVNSSKENKDSSLSKDEINRIEIEEAQDKSESQTTSVIGRSKSKRNTQTKPKVLSGLDDELSSEFNQY